MEAGVGHSGQPAPNAEDPEWRLCPDAEALLAPLLPLRGLQRSFMDNPAVVLVGSNMNLELSVQTSGEPRLTPPVSVVRCLCLAAACARLTDCARSYHFAASSITPVALRH